MPIIKLPDTDLKLYLIAFDAAGNERGDDGDGVDGRLSRRVLVALDAQPITDVFLFSHGWKNDVPEARASYLLWVATMLKQRADIAAMRAVRPAFRPLLVGLHWPSQPWGNEELGAGGAFAAVAATPLDVLIERYAERTADTPAAREALRVILTSARDNMAAFELPPEVVAAYQILDHETGLGSEGEAAAPGHDREPFDPEQSFELAEDEVASFGGGSGFGGILWPLRQLSFWKMKDRARVFGEGGGASFLRELQRAAPATTHFHLMGHSFGCIAVSAMIAGSPAQVGLARPVDSVVLVQGALSLWSYSSLLPVGKDRPGYFHSIIANNSVRGPIVTTQSQFDTAVGHLYPLAAGVARQIQFAPGDFPKYGALGSFGARGEGLSLDQQHTQMLSADGSYGFERGKIYNLDGSTFIREGAWPSGAHSDIARSEVAHVVWQAALST